MARNPEVDVQVKLLFQQAVKEMSNALASAAANIKVGFSVQDNDMKKVVAHLQDFFNRKESLQLFTKDSKIDEREIGAWAKKALSMFDKVLATQPALSVQFKGDMSKMQKDVDSFMSLMKLGMTDKAAKLAEEMMSGIPQVFSRMSTAVASSGLKEKLDAATKDVKAMIETAKKDMTGISPTFDMADAESKIDSIVTRLGEIDEVKIDLSALGNYIAQVTEMDNALKSMSGGKKLSAAFMEYNNALLDFQEGSKSIDVVNASLGKFVAVADAAGVNLETFGDNQAFTKVQAQVAALGATTQETARRIAEDMNDVSLAIIGAVSGDTTPPASLLNVLEVVQDIITDGKLAKEEIAKLTAKEGYVAVNFDMGNFEDQIEGVQKTFDKVKETIKSVDVTKTLDPSGALALQESYAKLKEQMQAVLEEQKELKQTQKDLYDKAADNNGLLSPEDAKRFSELVKAQEQLGAQSSDIARQFEGVNAAITKFNSSITSVENMHEALGQVGQTMRDIKQLGVPIPAGFSDAIDRASAGLFGLKNIMTTATSIAGEVDKHFAFAGAGKGADNLKELAEAANINFEDFKADYQQLWQDAAAEAKVVFDETGGDLGDIIGMKMREKLVAHLKAAGKEAGSSQESITNLTDAATSGEGIGENASRIADVLQGKGGKAVELLGKVTKWITEIVKRFAGVLIVIGAIVNALIAWYGKWNELDAERDRRQLFNEQQLSKLRVQNITHESQLRIAALESAYRLDQMRYQHQQKITEMSLTATSYELQGQQKLLDMEMRRAKAREAGVLREKEITQQNEKVSEILAQGRERTALDRDSTRKSNMGLGMATGAAGGAAAGAAIGSVIPGAGTVLGAAVGTGVGLIAGAITTYFKEGSGKLRNSLGQDLDKSISEATENWGGWGGFNESKWERVKGTMLMLDEELSASMEAKFKEASAETEAIIKNINALDVEMSPTLEKELNGVIESRNKVIQELATSTSARVEAMWGDGVNAAKERAKWDEKQGQWMIVGEDGREKYVDSVEEYYAQNQAAIQKQVEESKKLTETRTKAINIEMKAIQKRAEMEAQAQAAQEARIKLEIEIEKNLKERFQSLAEAAAASVGEYQDHSGTSQMESGMSRSFEAFQELQMAEAKRQGKDAENRMRVQQAQEKSIFSARLKEEMSFRKEQFDLYYKLERDKHQLFVTQAVEVHALRMSNEKEILAAALANRKADRELFQRVLDRQLDRSLVTADTYGKNQFDVERDLNLIDIADKYDKLITALEDQQRTRDAQEVAAEKDRNLQERQTLMTAQTEESAEFERQAVAKKHELEMAMMKLRFEMQLKFIAAEVKYKHDLDKAYENAQQERKQAYEGLVGTVTQGMSMEDISKIVGHTVKSMEELSDDDQVKLNEYAERASQTRIMRLEASLKDYFGDNKYADRMTEAGVGKQYEHDANLSEEENRKNAIEWERKRLEVMQSLAAEAKKGLTEQVEKEKASQPKVSNPLWANVVGETSQVQDAWNSSKDNVLNGEWFNGGVEAKSQEAAKVFAEALATITDDAVRQQGEALLKARNDASNMEELQSANRNMMAFAQDRMSGVKGTGGTISGEERASTEMNQASADVSAISDGYIDALMKNGDIDHALTQTTNDLLKQMLKAQMAELDKSENMDAINAIQEEINQIAKNEMTMQGKHQQELEAQTAKQEQGMAMSAADREERNANAKAELERAKKVEEERAKIEAERKKREEKLNADMIKIMGAANRQQASTDTDFALDMATASTGTDWQNAVMRRNRETQYNSQMRDLDARHRLEAEQLEKEYEGRGVPEEVRAQMQERQADEKAQIDNNKRLAEGIAGSMKEVGSLRSLVSEGTGQKSDMASTWERIQASAFGHVQDPAADAVINMDRNMQLQHANLMSLLTLQLPQIAAGMSSGGGKLEVPQSLLNALQGRNQQMQQTQQFLSKVTNNNYSSGLAGGANGNAP